MKKSILYVFFLFFFSNLFAQNPQFEWAHSVASTSTEHGNEVITDAQGNVYHIGYFNGTMDMDPGPAVFNLVAGGDFDTYIQKLDSAGNFIWAKQLGGTGTGNTVSTLAKDGVQMVNNELLIAGIYTGTIDFDPGLTVQNKTATGTSNDLFVLKLDTAGNFLWVKTIDTWGSTILNTVEVDLFDNIYLGGQFKNSIDVDPGTSVSMRYSAGSYDCYVVKLDNQANFLWAHTFGDAGADKVADISIDPNQNDLIVCGDFIGTVDFDPNTFNSFFLTSNTNRDAYILKLSAGGTLDWAKQVGGSGNDAAQVIVSDANGGIYCAGVFQGTVDLNPNAPQYWVSSSSVSYLQDNFIIKLDTAGNFVYGKTLTSRNPIIYRELCLDHSGNLIFYGVTGDSLDVDPSTQVYNVGSGNIFLGKYTPQMSLIWAISIAENEFVMPEGFHYAGPDAMYISGAYRYTCDFDFSSGVTNLIAPSTMKSAFIVKLNESSCIDTTVVVSQDTLTAMATGAGLSYTWIDCATGQPIPGANSQTYVAPINGNYAVSITDGSCSTISSCYYASPVACDSVEVSFTIAQNSSNLFDLSLQPYLAGSMPGNAISLTWDFGDGSPQVVISPFDTISHIYPNFGIYNICVTVFDSTLNCTDTYCDPLGIDSTGTIFMRGATNVNVNVQPVIFTSVNSSTDHLENSSNLEMQVYPNPTGGLLNIALNNSVIEEYTLQLVSINGQVLRTLPLNNQLTTLDVSELPKGVYVIHLQSATDHQSQLFIKK